MQKAQIITQSATTQSNRALRKPLRTKLGYLVAAALAVSISACQPPAKKIEVAPVAPPARPTPPNNAAEGMYITPADPVTGQRLTPNSNLSMDETIWNYRMAFNVSVRLCRDPEYTALVDYYRLYINNMQGPLKTVNANLDRDFKARYPAGDALRIRDTHSTDMYNYFSLPPVTPGFCQLMMARAPKAASITAAELPSFSSSTLQEIDDLFVKFYADYEDYLRRLAQWDARYGLKGNVIVGGGALYDNGQTPPKPTMPGGK